MIKENKGGRVLVIHSGTFYVSWENGKLGFSKTKSFILKPIVMQFVEGLLKKRTYVFTFRF